MSIFKKNSYSIAVDNCDVHTVEDWLSSVGVVIWLFAQKVDGEKVLRFEATKKQWKKLVEINAMNAKFMDKFMFTEIEA